MNQEHSKNCLTHLKITMISKIAIIIEIVEKFTNIKYNKSNIKQVVKSASKKILMEK